MKRKDVVQAILSVAKRADGVLFEVCSEEYVRGYKDALRACMKSIPKEKKMFFRWKR